MVHYVCWPFACFIRISCLQIFSINMKAIGGSLVTLVSWLGSFAISYSFSFLMDWSSAGKAPDAIAVHLLLLFFSCLKKCGTVMKFA